jgi:hypothetical protein
VPRPRNLTGWAALAALPLLVSCSSDCTNVATNISAVCLPDVVAEGQVAVVDAREACGILCARTPHCDVVLMDGTLVFGLHEDQCQTLTPGCEFTPCSQRVTACRIPELTAGDYPVIVPGSESRILHVRATGGVSSCRLPVP